MFQKLLTLEFRAFFRSRQFTSGLLGKIGMLFLFAYLAILLFSAAFAMYFTAVENHQNPVRTFCRYFLVYLAGDLVSKFLMQQLPANNIKPLMTLNIPRAAIARYTLVKIMLSFFSWAFLIFSIPFGVLLLSQGHFAFINVSAVMASAFCIVLCNSFINIFVNKNNYILAFLLLASATAALLHYFGMVNIFRISEVVFYGFFTSPSLAVIPLAVFLTFALLTLRFIRKNLYLDRGLETAKSSGGSKNIGFLDKYGTAGVFLNNDIRLIARSKAARSAVFSSVLFLFYGFLIHNDHTAKHLVMFFPGILVTGGFMILFGQRVPAWDSSYYPLMMTQNMPYRDYLRAKWILIEVGIILSSVLAVFYGILWGWQNYLLIVAAGIYNLGINSFIVLLQGAFNKKPIDLNSSTKGFVGGQNNFNLKMILLGFVMMLLPMGIFGLSEFLLNFKAAVAVIFVIGIAGLLLRDRILSAIVNVYREQKYTTLEAYKQFD